MTASSLRSNARRLLRQPGCRSDARRRWRLLHLDRRGGPRSSLAARNGAVARTLLRRRPAWRDAPQPGEKCSLDRGAVERISAEANVPEDQLNCSSSAPNESSSQHASSAGPRPRSMKRSTSAGTRCSSPPISKPRTFWAATDCREFALKTLDRILAEAWDPAKGFLASRRRPCARRFARRSGFRFAALLDAYETTLDLRYFQIAEHAMRLAVERFGDPDGGGFFDRAKDAAPMGGLDVRRKPMQDSPTPGCKFRRRDRSRSSLRSHRRKALSRLGGENARSVRRPGPAIRTIRGNVRARRAAARAPSVAGCGHRRRERSASPAELEKAAHEIYRFGKAVLRVTPEQIASGSLPPALRETLPHLDAAKPQALVCIETTCHPPISDRSKLTSLARRNRRPYRGRATMICQTVSFRKVTPNLDAKQRTMRVSRTTRSNRLYLGGSL